MATAAAVVHGPSRDPTDEEEHSCDSYDAGAESSDSYVISESEEEEEEDVEPLFDVDALLAQSRSLSTVNGAGVLSVDVDILMCVDLQRDRSVVKDYWAKALGNVYLHWLQPFSDDAADLQEKATRLLAEDAMLYPEIGLGEHRCVDLMTLIFGCLQFRSRKELEVFWEGREQVLTDARAHCWKHGTRSNIHSLRARLLFHLATSSTTALKAIAVACTGLECGLDCKSTLPINAVVSAYVAALEKRPRRSGEHADCLQLLTAYSNHEFLLCAVFRHLLLINDQVLLAKLLAVFDMRVRKKIASAEGEPAASSSPSSSSRKKRRACSYIHMVDDDFTPVVLPSPVPAALLEAVNSLTQSQRDMVRRRHDGTASMQEAAQCFGTLWQARQHSLGPIFSPARVFGSKTQKNLILALKHKIAHPAATVRQLGTKYGVADSTIYRYLCCLMCGCNPFRYIYKLIDGQGTSSAGVSVGSGADVGSPDKKRGK